MVLLWLMMTYRQIQNVPFTCMCLFFIYYLYTLVTVQERFQNNGTVQSCPNPWSLNSNQIQAWLKLPNKFNDMFSLELDQLVATFKGRKDPFGEYVMDEQVHFPDPNLNEEYFLIDKTLRDLSIIHSKLYNDLIYA